MTDTTELLPCPFWSKSVKSANGCWDWIGAKNAKGYGNFRSRSAHVVAYELVKGAIPTGLQIDHLCRNKSCINPDHLEAVTGQENTRRAQPTHCKHGHALSGSNVMLYARPDGIRRKCRECAKRHKSEARQKLRSEQHAQ